MQIIYFENYNVEFILFIYLKSFIKFIFIIELLKMIKMKIFEVMQKIVCTKLINY